ncbi:hypothetical protein, partial [Glaesserella parasuis]|uniref:hypothetical protein n=1 Tax=Glaesserella parasuis TaxID=738 RepID=UPI002436F47F
FVRCMATTAFFTAHNVSPIKKPLQFPVTAVKFQVRQKPLATLGRKRSVCRLLLLKILLFASVLLANGSFL